MASELKMTFALEETLQDNVLGNSYAGIHTQLLYFAPFIVLSIREAALGSFPGPLHFPVRFSDCLPQEHKWLFIGSLALAEGLSPQVVHIHPAQKRQLSSNCLI